MSKPTEKTAPDGSGKLCITPGNIVTGDDGFPQVFAVKNALGEPIPMIYTAMASIMEETKAIAKTEQNESQKYKFRGIDNVMNELHGVFAKYKVFPIPEVVEYEVKEKITEKTYNGQKTTSILYYTRVKVRYHFTTVDGSEIVTTNVGEAMDSGDKSMNKAMSAALKYALMQMLLIPTAEEKDPDAATPPETRPKTISEIIQSLDSVKDAALVSALTSITMVSDKDSLMSVWNTNSALHQNPTFTQCMSAKRKELGI